MFGLQLRDYIVKDDLLYLIYEAARFLGPFHILLADPFGKLTRLERLVRMVDNGHHLKAVIVHTRTCNPAPEYGYIIFCSCLEVIYNVLDIWGNILNDHVSIERSRPDVLIGLHECKDFSKQDKEYPNPIVRAEIATLFRPFGP